MKTILTIAFLIITCLLSNFSIAQTRAEKRAERKELRKLKKMDPVQIKGMMNSLEVKGDEVRNCNRAKTELENILKSKELEQEDFQITNDSLRTALVEIQEKTQSQSEFGLNQVPKKGTYYCVQLGAFEKFNSSTISGAGVTIQKDGNINKYILGAFGSMKAAEKVRKDFIKLGIKDAWIVKFKDGVRVPND